MRKKAKFEAKYLSLKEDFKQLFEQFETSEKVRLAQNKMLKNLKE